MKPPTNPNNKPEKPKGPLLKHSKVENQYFEKNGKQTAFMYLMQYPYETIVSYFIDELKVNVNIFSIVSYQNHNKKARNT